MTFISLLVSLYHDSIKVTLLCILICGFQLIFEIVALFVSE